MNTNFKKAFFFLLTTFYAISSMAGTIKGKITDKQSKEPLTGTTVQIVGTSLGAVADVDGNYTLSVKAGTYALEVR